MYSIPNYSHKHLSELEPMLSFPFQLLIFSYYTWSMRMLVILHHNTRKIKLFLKQTKEVTLHKQTKQQQKAYVCMCT